MNVSHDYWYWNNFFTKKEVQALNKSINKFRTKDDTKTKASKSIKTSTVYNVRYKDVYPNIADLIDSVWAVNEREFGYNLYQTQNPWLNYNAYKKGDQYTFHYDSSDSLRYDIKLTLLINVSTQKYKGGDFSILMSETPTPIKEFTQSGDVLLLKSHILHKVNPITQGTRESLTMFLTGPKFQ